MLRLSLILSFLALILSAFVLLTGCSGPVVEESGSSEGAASDETPSLEGAYDGRKYGAWNGNMKVRDVDAWQVHFAFDVTPIGGRRTKLEGTATKNGDQYTYEKDDCTITIEPAEHAESAALGDILVDASKGCALDFTATWRRVH